MTNQLIKRAYLEKIWYDQKYVVLWLSFFSLSFEFAFAWLLFEAEFNKLFESVAGMLPPSLMNFIGVSVGGEYYGSQLLAFGYSHPLVLISLSLLPIGLPARYISTEIENKTIDLLMVRSIHRAVVPTHTFLFLAIVLIFPILALFLGTYAGYLLFDLTIDPVGYLKVVLMTYFFYLSMGAISLAIASFQKERGKALAKSVSLFVFLYFFDTVIRLNKSLDYLTTYSYFNFNQPGKLLRGELDIFYVVIILVIISVVFLSIAVFQFNRRDL